MALTEFLLRNEKEYLQGRQETGNYAVGVVPFLQDDVVLIRRVKWPSAGKYAIVTGHIELREFQKDINYWTLYRAKMWGEELSDPLRPGMMVESRRIGAMRELYEELYPQEKDIVRSLSSRRTNKVPNYVISRMNEHRFVELMDVIDTRTKFLMSVFSAKIYSSPSSPESKIKMLEEVKRSEINPLSQFVLKRLGLLDDASIDIKFARLKRVKDLYTWQERQNAYAIEY